MNTDEKFCLKTGNAYMPLLGAAYYPEAWDESEQSHDIANMKAAGITVVRMAEFAWHKMEPKEGRYNFRWLHDIIDRLDKAGISVMLGTPSAAPPVWLNEIDCNMLVLDENGQRRQHGARRNHCSNNPTFRKYSSIIARKMALEFGADKRVIAWQVDNEIYPNGNGCYCEHCQKAFADYLKKKYSTVEELNRRWNLNLFSQAYESFAEIPMPKSSVWHGPHLKYEWMQFNSDSHIDFIKMQTDILHRYTNAPVGTDMMPVFGIDYEKMAEFSDIMQFNHYDDEETLHKTAFWFDYIRSFKEVPFWNTETSTCWNGSTATPSNLRPEGFCRANSWLPIVLGGGANLYWLWRQHWAGHELMHGSVLYASGRPMHIFGEVKEVGEGFKKASDFISGTSVKTQTAMMISYKNNMLFSCQPITSPEDEKEERTQLMYRYITNSGIRPDIISPSKSLEEYKLLFTPYMMSLEEGDLRQRIEQWVRDGGVWVAGPMTDIRNDVGAHYTDRETGILERLTDSLLVHQIPDHQHRIACSWQDNTEYMACHWLQLFDLQGDAEPLVKVTGGFSTLVGKTLVFRKRVGKGTIIVVGALPEETDAKRLIDIALANSGAEVLSFTGGIVAASREGEKFSGISAQEVCGEAGRLYFDGSMTDLLTGKVYKNEAEFSPYQTMILSK